MSKLSKGLLFKPVLIRAIKEATYNLTDINCLFNFDGTTIVSDDLVTQFTIECDNITAEIHERFSGRLIGTKQFVDYKHKTFEDLVVWIINI